MMTIVASQWNCCSPEVVEDGENIVAPIVAEYQRDQGGNGTDYCCKLLLLSLLLLSLLMQIIAEIIVNDIDLCHQGQRGIIEIWYSIIQEEWGGDCTDDEASNGNYPIW